MASSSGSTLPDVYVSHRVEDTGKTFTSHLISALDKSAIEAIIDDRPNDGEEISETFLNMIPESLISVVILSKNYAGSQRCLDELVKIMTCVKENGATHHALPVFIGVEPTHVQKQIEAFGAAFEALIKENQQCKEKENTWRRALFEIADHSGWDSNNTRSEAEMVKRIVDRIVKIINNQPSNYSNDDFVGISRVDTVESLLCLTLIEDVLFVGIWGMQGIGKTTIAEIVFNRISNQFNGTCFLRNVRERLERKELGSLYKDMLKQLSKSCKPLKQLLKSFNSPNLSSPRVQGVFKRNKFLIVFDDVTSSHQLNSLGKPLHFYGPGSRIISTGTDNQVLKIIGCKEERIYKVEELNECEALRLFEAHAFKQQPCTERHKELSKIALRYCKGLPLALKVLGCNLFGKDIGQWESELGKLANHPNAEIKDILMISYAGLEETEKSIFLDIACVFVRREEGVFVQWGEGPVKNILDGCGFYATRGIRRLQDKALITIRDSRLEMHDLLRQMGQDIVLQEPGGPSRIWRWKDFYDVMTRNMGIEKVEVISVVLSEVPDMDVMPEAFEKMLRLRVFQLHFPYFSSTGIQVHLPKGLRFLSDKLTYLQWHRYPLASLPDKFLPNNLIELHMRASLIVQLWGGGVEPHVPNLKVMNLSYSKHLISLPDFSKYPNLEKLYLYGCFSLIEIPSSIQHLSKLRYLYLGGCLKLAMLPLLPTNVVMLDLSTTAIGQLPSWIGELKCLENLDVSGCKSLTSLPESLGNIKSLVYLDIGFSGITSLPSCLCHLSELKNLYCGKYKGTLLPPLALVSTLNNRGIDPQGLGLVSLVKLDLSKSNVESLPSSIKHLPKLRYLSLEDCKNLTSLPDLPSSLEVLEAKGCTFLQSLSSSLFGGDASELGGFRFNLANCINLDGDSIIRFMAEAGPRIEAIAAEWAKSKYPCKIEEYNNSSLCIPGSVVPEWFQYKEEGSLVKLKLFGHKKLADLSGLAFCCVVSPGNGHGDFDASCKCLLGSEKFGPLQFQTSWYERERLGDYVNGIESEHVVIWYVDIRQYLRNDIQQLHSPLICSEATFEFEAGFYGYRIIRCGVTPVGRNCETSWAPPVEDGSQGEEGEEGPSRKRLKSNNSTKI